MNAPQPRTLTPRSRWTGPVLLANLVAQIGIVATGGLVRLTSSGLGCVTWPQCQPGSFVPVAHAATGNHQAVEFGNRLLTFVLTAIAVAVLVLVRREVGRSAAFRRLAWIPLLGIVAQAVVGGVSVLLQLAPVVVGLHFLLSMALVAASAWLVVRWAEGDGPVVRVADGRTRTMLVVLHVVMAVVLALGVVVTGAGPHSGDDEVGYRFAVDPFAAARVHAAAVWLLVAVLVALLVRLRRTPGTLRSRALVLGAVVLAQGAIGYVQLFTGLPIALVNLHMVGAAVLVALLTWLAGAARTRAVVAPDAAPGGVTVDATA